MTAVTVLKFKNKTFTWSPMGKSTVFGALIIGLVNSVATEMLGPIFCITDDVAAAEVCEKCSFVQQWSLFCVKKL